MRAKVIIARATKETEEILNSMVRKVSETTSIKAYPSVDFEAVFFPVDRNDQKFILNILSTKGFTTRIENAK